MKDVKGATGKRIGDLPIRRVVREGMHRCAAQCVDNLRVGHGVREGGAPCRTRGVDKTTGILGEERQFAQAVLN